MIITVTMNPALDKTIKIEKLEHGGLNRIQHIEMDAGGKGINVSKTIEALGGQSLAAGFLGGAAGKVISGVLQEKGIENRFIEISGETRTNTKIAEEDGTVTELNEPGPIVGAGQLDQLMELLEEYADEHTLLVLAGSIPGGVGKDIYRDIAERAHKKGAKILLDADGDAFACAMEAKPDLIKPNRAELEEFFQMDHQMSEEELVQKGKELLNRGVATVAVSLGQQGALFLREDQILRCGGLQVEVHSTVGAGDAMMAALAYGMDLEMEFEETVKLAMAVAAGAVTTTGTKPPEKELIEKLKEKVVVTRL